MWVCIAILAGGRPSALKFQAPTDIGLVTRRRQYLKPAVSDHSKFPAERGHGSTIDETAAFPAQPLI
jgi:hypothetical protein